MGQRPAKRITLYCEVCQEPFELLESVYRARTKASDKPRFCSRKCMGIAKTIPESRTTVSCGACGKEFVKRTDHVSENNYCSKECRAVGRRIPDAKWRDPKQIKAYMKEYRAKNLDRLNAKRVGYVNPNKEQKLISQKKYRDTHKDYIAFISRARAYDIRSAKFDQEEWDALKAKYDYTCLCCKKQEPEIKLEMDHVIPLSKGGKHDISNFQPLCRTCNAAKFTKCTDYR